MATSQRVTTPEGARVILFNPGAQWSPEDVAMLQSLYSRDPRSVDEHIKTVELKGSGSFMNTYYVKYGHKSIGDCATATVFVENVSMLAAKALQDFPLYSGQEVSTRYIDMQRATMVGGERVSGVQRRAMDFYRKCTSELTQHLSSLHPYVSGSRTEHDKAIRAAAFDRARAWLPAGTTTSLSIHTNIRQFADHMLHWRWHPLKEVRNIANALESLLAERFPNSSIRERYPDRESYNSVFMARYYLEGPATPYSLDLNVNFAKLSEWGSLVTHRPAKTELPGVLNECGCVELNTVLDFASFRDLQRHRSVTTRMPLLTTELGVHPWYLDLPGELAAEAVALIASIRSELRDVPKEDAQYGIPMGFQVPVRVTGGVASMVYIVELRSQITVHPTLRIIAQRVGNEIEKKLGIKVHVDNTPNQFTEKRGAQDIIKKSFTSAP